MIPASSSDSSSFTRSWRLAEQPSSGLHEIARQCTACVWRAPWFAAHCYPTIIEALLVAGTLQPCSVQPRGGGSGQQAGAPHRGPVGEGPGQDAAHSCKVPLPFQHARPFQGNPSLPVCMPTRCGQPRMPCMAGTEAEPYARPTQLHLHLVRTRSPDTGFSHSPSPQ